MKIPRRHKKEITIKRRIKKKKSRRRFPYLQTGVTQTAHLKNILKNLESISSQGYRLQQVFVDWIDLMFWAFQRNDPKYLETMNRYNNDKDNGKRPADYFSYALGELLAHMKMTNEEVLGYLYMECSANKNQGQFFTPPSISSMMSLLVNDDKKINGDIYDPCCGAGTFLISQCKVMTCKEVDKSKFIGQDIDFTCVQMTTLNLMFFNLPGMVIWGNTLKLEVKEVYLTRRSYLYGGSIIKAKLEDGLITKVKQLIAQRRQYNAERIRS